MLLPENKAMGDNAGVPGLEHRRHYVSPLSLGATVASNATLWATMQWLTGGSKSRQLELIARRP